MKNNTSARDYVALLVKSHLVKIGLPIVNHSDSFFKAVDHAIVSIETANYFAAENRYKTFLYEATSLLNGYYKMDKTSIRDWYRKNYIEAFTSFKN